MKLYPIDTAPIHKEILLYWKELDHFENGRIYKFTSEFEEGFDHLLFDNESLENNPTHWAEPPKFEFKG